MGSSLATRIREANAALLGTGDLEADADYFTSDYVAHVTEKDMTGGHAFVAKFVGMLQRAFSELEVEVEILVEGDDRVAWQRTLRATHTGTFQGFPATGAPLVWRDMATSRFEGDRIAEEWVISDLAERLLLARK